MAKFTSQIRVRYADTDKMQFVYNGKYLEYFEVGRTELLRNIGLPYSELEKAGFQLPLIEASLKYKKPAVYDDLLDIEANVSAPYSAKVHIEYKITNHETGYLICEGFTSHMFIHADSKKPTRPPKVYVEKLAKYFPAK
ncbi:MAG: acyl-CoA thioesterase [Bacteroidetes bacterium]|nr:acyl-CoA thioesterase [Bacteroidota bacterium]MBU1115959.1 acyl-CoA thioesterase [Bacteroidota bacterium]MBU1798444.1 acyl-CoA thioesterase [Bacteroidota bacterium]